MNHAQDAKRTLFHLGHELPGRRLRQFAIDLLVATRDGPGASPATTAVKAVGRRLVAADVVRPDRASCPQT